jgi:hypothetical protein
MLCLAMSAPHDEYDAFVSRVMARLPPWMQRWLAWLRHRPRRWLRIPLALLLIAGGVMWFLPLLGLWMLPLGIILLAEDVPPLRQPVVRIFTRLERWWGARRRKE